VPSISKILREVADRYDAEESAETLEGRLKALESRGLTGEEVVAALEKAGYEITPAEAAKIEKHADDGVGKNDDGDGKGEEKPPPPEKKTRPGRKSGNAYQFTVDDEGNVKRSDTAVIYNGPDEPEEVELPA